MTLERTVLLVVHTGREEATETARRVEKVLNDNNIGLRVLSAEAVDRGPAQLAPADMRALGVDIEVVDTDHDAADGCEMVVGPGSPRVTPTSRCGASTWAASGSWPKPRPRLSTVCSSTWWRAATASKS